MTQWEIIGLAVVVGLLALMVFATRRAAADRKGRDVLVDSDGDGGGD